MSAPRARLPEGWRCLHRCAPGFHNRVTAESKRVQLELFERVEADLVATRQQRDVAMEQFAELNAQLESHLREQQKFKIAALSGFCMGMISLSSVVLTNLFEKR